MSDDLDLPVSETRNKGGRPRKLVADEATLKQITGLGRLQATVRECAAFLQVSPVTYEAFLKEPGVRDAYDEGVGHGLLSLRRSQLRLAEKNAAMGIWCGKQYLGQRDRQEHEHTGANGGPIQHVDLSQVSDDDLRRLEAVLGVVAEPGTGAGALGADSGGEDPAEG